MWNYERRLEYPVNITHTDPKLAQMIISQYGGLCSEYLQITVLTKSQKTDYRDISIFR